MNLHRLARFLAKAREKCSYEVVGEAGETRLPDGTRVIGPYTESVLAYTDRYKGIDPFEGKEEISESGKVVWERKYEGCIIDSKHKGKEAASKLYDFLKRALREFPRDEPFKRGPLIFNDDLEFTNEAGQPDALESAYQYSDACRGDISSFAGRELITHEGEVVYMLSYKGGLKA